MIIRENVIEVEGYDEIDMLEVNGEKCKPEELIFFDLEHYVYKKPKCIGVFGACIYNNIEIDINDYNPVSTISGSGE